MGYLGGASRTNSAITSRIQAAPRSCAAICLARSCCGRSGKSFRTCSSDLTIAASSSRKSNERRLLVERRCATTNIRIAENSGDGWGSRSAKGSLSAWRIGIYPPPVWATHPSFSVTNAQLKRAYRNRGMRFAPSVSPLVVSERPDSSGWQGGSASRASVNCDQLHCAAGEG